jgi:cytochrome b
MNTRSASPAEGFADTEAHAAPAARSVLVWDLPVRVFHSLAVLSFVGAYLSAESERWRLLHVTLGYTLAGLVVFRVVWGFVGTRHARFANFVRGPAAVWAYLRNLVRGQPVAHSGHNPAGAVAIVAMLGLAAAIGASGWAVYEGRGSEWLEALHALLANTMVALVGIHIAGVVLGSWLHGSDLARSMVTGRKPASPEEAIASAWRGLAVLMVVAVIGFWGWQWQQAPAAAPLTTAGQQDHDADD